MVTHAQCVQVSDRAKKRGKTQLGTLGAGNHYVEVQVTLLPLTVLAMCMVVSLPAAPLLIHYLCWNDFTLSGVSRNYASTDLAKQHELSLHTQCCNLSPVITDTQQPTASLCLHQRPGTETASSLSAYCSGSCTMANLFRHVGKTQVTGTGWLKFIKGFFFFFLQLFSSLLFFFHLLLWVRCAGGGPGV